MNINRFVRNFLSLREALQTQNFSSKELNSLCMQGAIEYEKLYLEEARGALEEAKVGLEAMQLKAKLELERLNAQHQLEATKAQMLNSLIQSQSMLKSLKDNAAINRANAYVSFLQVVGNASNASGIAQHADNVVKTINRIGLDQGPSPLDGYLNQLAQSLGHLSSLEEEAPSIELYTQSLETLPDHPIKVWGYSTLKNARESFSIDGAFFCEGNTMLFKASTPKRYTILFVSQNRATRIEKSINILVSDDKMPILK
ncbi:hypothetical protein [Helicobacter salomonis]|uniref:hypothetical protein n=1 Tax=Helicobacter salomonis TaxID=56878 RepID=UPI000CF1A329|nr:hypothetical protein [Helicobacter salomonis]